MTKSLDDKAFRSLVDEAVTRVQLDTEAEIVTHYAKPFVGIQPGQRTGRLHELIGDILCIEDAGETGQLSLRKLKRAIKLQGVLGEPELPYVPLLAILADATRKGPARPFADRDRWLDAIDAARALLNLGGDPYDCDLREQAVLAAGQRVAARGINLLVRDDRFDLPDEELRSMSQAIDRRVAEMGGLALIHQVIGYILATENEYFGRYTPGRRFGFEPREPSLPVGYLLQLGIRHLAARPAPTVIAKQLWADIVAETVDLCALLDVEPYSNMEHLVLNPFDIAPYLGSVTLFDHLFALRQWPPGEAEFLLRGVLRGLDTKLVEAKTGWSLDDLYALLRATLTLSSEPMAIVTPESFIAAGLAQDAWKRLQADFVHGLDGPNSGYLTPLDSGKAELDFKPLFALPNGHLLIIMPSLACLGFYEAATRALRNAKYPEFDSCLGRAVEAVAVDALKRSGLNVTVEGGEYRLPGTPPGKISGECDIVVETETMIVLIELKKKPLRRISSSGDPAAGLVDLSASLFAAQEQLGRHELALVRAGKIAFENGYVLEPGEREIQRLALTWLDYGGLQDKFLLTQIFHALAGRRLSASDPAVAKHLKGLNDAIALLEQEMRELVDAGKEADGLFQDCWFLSVPQLLMLLEGVSDPAEFDKRVQSLGHLSFRTLDFYRDFEFARRQNLI